MARRPWGIVGTTHPPLPPARLVLPGGDGLVIAQAYSPLDPAPKGDRWRCSTALLMRTTWIRKARFVTLEGTRR
jgi:hypothetical protein